MIQVHIILLTSTYLDWNITLFNERLKNLERNSPTVPIFVLIKSDF